MRGLDDLEQMILSALVKSYGKADSFTLYRKSQASLSLFTKAISNLADENLLFEEGNNIKVTLEGREVIARLIKNRKERPWRLVPVEFTQPKLRVNEFYVPRRSLLDKKTFKTLDNDID